MEKEYSLYVTFLGGRLERFDKILSWNIFQECLVLSNTKITRYIPVFNILYFSDILPKIEDVPIEY